MITSYDLIILGGGCAGLSLATNLIQTNSKISVLIIEQRTCYSHDRTWCFFGENNVFRSDIQHSWPSMRVISKAGEVLIDCNSSCYVMVNAEKFYNNAQSLIAQSNSIDLKLGIVISDVSKQHGGLWNITTETGNFKSRYIVDTRPAFKPIRGNAKLWQSFYGAEIKCDFDTFDINCGDLMNFSAADACGARNVLPKAVCFVYVLPSSSDRALIEFTAFGPDPLIPEDLDGLLMQAISQRTSGAKYTVLKREYGVLPMGAKSIKLSHDSSYVTAGLTAGGARPSSGYAFTRIQNWAFICAKSLTDGNGPVTHAHDGLVQKLMDELFLRLLRSRPDLAPDLFIALFSGTETNSMIRFLSDRASLKDYARVIASLLPGPLLRALFVRKSASSNLLS